METVELRAICRLSDGTELIQTGIYVFKDTTIEHILKIMEKGIRTKEFGVLPIVAVEIPMSKEMDG